MIVAMTRSPASLALALALVGCGAPVPAGDAGADVVTYAIAGRWVASSPELVPPSTWELEVDNMLRGTVTVTTSEPCGGAQFVSVFAGRESSSNARLA